MSANNSDFFKQMRMIIEGKEPLKESNDQEIVVTLGKIIKALGIEDEILPLMATKLENQNLSEQELSEERGGFVKMIIGALFAAAMFLGGNAIMSIVHKLGGVPEEYRSRVEMGSDVTGRYDGWVDNRIHESSGAFFSRMKAIMEGEFDNNSTVIDLFIHLIKLVGGEDEFIATVQSSETLHEAILEEGNRRGLIGAILALIVAFGLMMVDKVGAFVTGNHDWRPAYTLDGGIAGWRDATIHDPGRPE